MIRKAITVLLLLGHLTLASAQGNNGFMLSLDSLIGKAQELVLSGLSGKTGSHYRLAVSGIDLAGSQIPLGDIFSLRLSTALANRKLKGVTILSRNYQSLLRHERVVDRAEAGNPGVDFLVTGSAFILDEEVLVVVQMISVADSTVLEGFERKLPLTDTMRAYLRRTAPLLAGADRFEPDNSFDNASPLDVGEVVRGHTLSPGGDTDWFAISTEGLALDSVDALRIYTSGTTDTYIELYGPNNPFALLAANDDNEETDDENASLSVAVSRGQTYWVMVRGYEQSTTGPYTITAEFEE